MFNVKAANAASEKLLAECCTRQIERVFLETCNHGDDVDMHAVNFGARSALGTHYRETLRRESTPLLVSKYLTLQVAHGFAVPRDTLDDVMVGAMTSVIDERHNTDEWLDKYLEEHGTDTPNEQFAIAWMTEVLRLAQA